MPPKRKNIKDAKKMSVKQKKVIETRLMEISKKIDRYVYKNEKLITVVEAAKYIEEMFMYKIQCCGDERTLQVIEKINRCMNAIIAELQDNNDEYGTHSEITYTQTNCPSPAYSLLDENILPQPIEINLDKRSMLIVNGIETVELSDDDDDFVDKEIQVDVEIHRAMSNLSVQNNEDTLQITQDISSQSILDNFIPNCAIGINNYSKTLASNNNEKINTVLTSDNVIPIENNHKKIIDNVTKLDNTAAKIRNIYNTENVKNVHDIATNTSDTKQEKCKVSNKKKTFEHKETKKNIARNINTIKKKTKPKRKVNNDLRNTRTKNCDTQDNMPRPGILKAGSTYESANPNNAIKRTTKLNFTNMSHDEIPKEPIPTIYNKVIENDLSWIESIRFVREVNANEFEAIVSTNSFWDNFDYPENWDNQDWEV